MLQIHLIPVAELSQRYPAWGVATVDERFATYTTAQIIDNSSPASIWI